MSSLEKLIWPPDASDSQKEFIISGIQRLSLLKIEALARNAAQIRMRAYAPYSGYFVGASMLDIGGNYWNGANVEVCSYSETGHAEEMTVKNAAVSGIRDRYGANFVDAIAVAHLGDSAPCGRCRQTIGEFCKNCLVIIADTEGMIRNVTSLEILLPNAFTPSHLGKG
jgi:cytidine deaminase